MNSAKLLSFAQSRVLNSGEQSEILTSAIPLVKKRSIGQIGVLTLGMMAAVASQSLANPAQFKAYKGAYPDVKMQCNYCHAVDKPTKDAHDLNAYGLAAKELSGAEIPTQEIYQQLGRSEDFKASEAAPEAAEVEETGEVQK